MPKSSAVLASILLLLLPTRILAQPQPLGPLWRDSHGSVVLTECPEGGDHDAGCRAVELRSAGAVTKLGAGYMRVKLLWARKGHERGPNALLLGDYGGSGGNSDLFAVTTAPAPRFRKLGGERYDTVEARSVNGALRLTLPFDVEFFNGAPHSGAIIASLPAVWTGRDFAVDLRALTRRTYSASERSFRVLAIREELRGWAGDKYPTPRLYPPQSRNGTQVTATAMIEMILSGHADQARDVLDRSWPRQWEHSDRPLGGQADFWAALCQQVLNEPNWERFGLARLPHADIVRRGALGQR